MKAWTLIGVILAVVGVALFLNGLNNRLGTTRSPGVTIRDSLAIKNSRIAARDSVIVESKFPDSRIESIESADRSRTPELFELTPGSVVSHSEKIPVGIVKEKPGDAGQSNSSIKLDQIVFTNDPDGRKRMALKKMKEANWSADELMQLAGYLDDPRAIFRSEILVRNSTFTENAEQYAHNLTPESISRCIQFVQDQQDALDAARRAQGVPVEVLVAILKVETNLGEWRGKESVFNVFWSLSLGDNHEVQQQLLSRDPATIVEMKGRMNKRALWARSQLRDLLYVARHGGENPVGILGSFAGAFGLSQFIPSSYRSFGRDGNSDGVVDLDAFPDAALSIAYYLRENGWPSKPDRARMRKAILIYNHSGFYADCVMTLADTLSLRLTGAPIAN